MKLKQNDLERLLDLVRRGEMTAEQANIEKVRIKRVELVTGRLSAEVRKSLNGAVKAGKLCHMKKDGGKPEAYYHPTFEYMAKHERREYEQSTLAALVGVIARPVDL